MRILGTSMRYVFPTLWRSVASFDGLVMRQGWNMFGDGGLNASQYSSFGDGVIKYGWYTWGAVVRVRSCNIDCHV
jgi:hypothetical protein